MALVGLPHPQHQGVRVPGTDDLQAGRQAGGSESARHAQCGDRERTDELLVAHMDDALARLIDTSVTEEAVSL